MNEICFCLPFGYFVQAASHNSEHRTRCELVNAVHLCHFHIVYLCMSVLVFIFSAVVVVCIVDADAVVAQTSAHCIRRLKGKTVE